MRWAPGTEIRGYVVEGVLGGGGVAVVYAARHRLLGTRHAIKVLSVDTPELRGRLRREAALHSRLDHPNLVPVRDVIEGEGGPGIVMPLVRGPTLAALLGARPLEVDEGVGLWRGIVAGVAHAHAAGVAHCDLKPGNVLLDLDGDGVIPRVTDFGLARLAGEGGADEATGTPGYMAPEQREDPASADHRADLYALGCVLCELLTGQRVAPEPAALPARWAGLVEALMQPDPQRRPGAAQLLQELGEGASARSLGSGSALARDARRFTPPLLVPRAQQGISDPEAPPHNLEPERDRFVGRLSELGVLEGAVRPGRLVTLVGPGGVGKTRLARQFGRRELDRRGAPGGVWLCALERARSEPELVADLLAALGLPPGIGARLESALASFAGALVILDNLEQLEPSAVSRLGRLVASAPEVAFLGTSREPVGLPGEQVLELAPLPLPGEAEALSDNAAARLFVGRAATAGASLDLAHEATASAVRRIVGLLDGLPLALEIAAARAAQVSLSSLADQLVEHLDARRQGAGPVRQRTLRATLDASWDLLEPWEQAVWAQLSVFEGGFTLADAEAVLGPEARPPQGGSQRAIERLIWRSLVRVEEEGVRFAMLSTVAAYACERLVDRGGARAVEARHGAWFARYGRAAVDDSASAEGRAPAADRANLVAATRRALRRGDDEVAVYAALGALAALAERGPVDAAIELGHAALEVAGPGPALCALLSATGRALSNTGAVEEAAAMLQRAMAESVSAGRTRIELEAGVSLGRVEAARDLRRAEQLLEEMRARAGEAGERLWEARAQAALAAIWADASRPEDAEPAARQAMAMLEELGQPRPARLLSLLASCLGQLGDLEGCLALAQEALSLSGRDLALEALLHNNLGNVASRQGRRKDAAGHFRTSIRLSRRMGGEGHALVPLYNLGLALSDQGELAQARTVQGEGLALARRLGDRLSEANALFALALLASQEDLLQEACEGYRACIEVAAHCDPVLGGFARSNLANVLRRQGELAVARAQAELAVAELEGHPLVRGVAATVLGQVLGEQGEPDAAEAHLQRALADAQDGDMRANTLMALSGFRWRAGRLQEARELAEQGAVEAHSSQMRALVLAWAGTLAVRAGDRGRAQQALAQARAEVAHVPPHSELGKDLSALEALLAEL
jgi:predicted ATPase